MTMFDKIKSVGPKSKPLIYNEQKVDAGIAECLLAMNFIKDLPQLSREDKDDRLTQRISLNNRAGRKIDHIAIAFSSQDTISNDLMKVIAKRYMKAIGFEEQPFLVYRHFDTGHPHFHIVSPNIRPDGSRIDIDPSCVYRVKELIKKWEIEFSLTKIRRIRPENEEKYKIQQAQKIIIGQTPIKRGISNVLLAVMDRYKYTDLSEFNALLRLYNLRAERGGESSLCYQNKGLMYHVLDEGGNKVGIPIKASAFLLKPTLPNLEQRFARNKTLQQQHLQRVTTAIDWSLAGQPPDWPGFREAMEEEGISVVVNPDKKDGPEGVFFIDLETKTVFSGESLGRGYGLDAIRAQCAQERLEIEVQEETLKHRHRFDL
jgi:hypothetical protein